MSRNFKVSEIGIRGISGSITVDFPYGPEGHSIRLGHETKGERFLDVILPDGEKMFGGSCEPSSEGFFAAATLIDLDVEKIQSEKPDE